MKAAKFKAILDLQLGFKTIFYFSQRLQEIFDAGYVTLDDSPPNLRQNCGTAVTRDSVTLPLFVERIIEANDEFKFAIIDSLVHSGRNA